MDLYTQTSLLLSEQLTKQYSTSFSSASRLFAKDIRPAVYAVYGLVRIADEIVDTYCGADARQLLDDLEREVQLAVTRGYSTNPIVHAFAGVASAYKITEDLTAPFFASMRMDLEPIRFTSEQYSTYIYGSAEVVGLMCLRVFCGGKTREYDELKTGAQHLGAAYQKVNFLRDFAHDTSVLKRYYFPGVQKDLLTEAQKADIIADIQHDFSQARPYIHQLPKNARPAVRASYSYYGALLDKLQVTPASVISRQRIRVSGAQKILLLIRTIATGGV